MRRLRLEVDPRRDASAIVALAGLIAYVGIPLVVGRWCSFSFTLPALTIAPLLLVAALVVRLRVARGSEAAVAVVLFVVLFLLELGIAFFVSIDHCGLELGASLLRSP